MNYGVQNPKYDNHFAEDALQEFIYEGLRDLQSLTYHRTTSSGEYPSVYNNSLSIKEIMDKFFYIVFVLLSQLTNLV